MTKDTYPRSFITSCLTSKCYNCTFSTMLTLVPQIDLDMTWHGTLSQSDPSIQSRQNHYVNRLSANGYNTSSYKVSIGHETVNITEIAGPCSSSPATTATMALNDRRNRATASQKGANILSLCFMCFVSACLILIAISTMHLLVKTNQMNTSDLIPLLLQSANITPGFLYMFGAPTQSTDTLSSFIISMYDRTIRDLANVVCLLIIVLNCFCLLVFSIEIYLGCNTMKSKNQTYRFAFSSSTARFVGICCFYASIPSLILVMSLYILLSLSLIPAIISLIILGIGLVFILITLLTYFSSWQSNNFVPTNEKLVGTNSSIYRGVGVTHINDDDIDLSKADELSTLV